MKEIRKGEKDMNYSPLRYPGGKSKIAPFVSLLIKKCNLSECTYVEPFAGGAGVALALLFEGTVTDIVINDYDKAIYSMWKAILTETEAFINLILNTPLTISEINLVSRLDKSGYILRTEEISSEKVVPFFNIL